MTTVYLFWYACSDFVINGFYDMLTFQKISDFADEFYEVNCEKI